MISISLSLELYLWYVRDRMVTTYLTNDELPERAFRRFKEERLHYQSLVFHENKF